MSLQTVAHRFVDLCNEGKNFDVMEQMYAPDIVSVEASGVQVAGKRPVIEKSRVWQANNTITAEKVRGPFFDSIDDPAARSSGQFAVHFSIDVTPKTTGRPITREEGGIYTVKDDQIPREQFYYDGAR